MYIEHSRPTAAESAGYRVTPADQEPKLAAQRTCRFTHRPTSPYPGSRTDAHQQVEVGPGRHESYRGFPCSAPTDGYRCVRQSRRRCENVVVDRAKEVPPPLNLDATMCVPTYRGGEGTMLFPKRHFWCRGVSERKNTEPKGGKMRGSDASVTVVPKNRPPPAPPYVAGGIASEDEGLGVRLGGRRPPSNRRAHRPAPAGPGLRAKRREWGAIL